MILTIKCGWCEHGECHLNLEHCEGYFTECGMYMTPLERERIENEYVAQE